MSVSIRAACPIDGPVDLYADRFSLVIDPVNEAESTYSFPCPVCRVLVTKPATQDVAMLLMSAGIKPTIRRAAQPTARHFDGPAFEIEDLRDFAAVLAETDYLADLIGA